MLNEQKQNTIVTALDGAVATITLNRPAALHAINAEMFDELESTFEQLTSDGAVRVVLITGSGERAFAAGADIRGLVDTDATTGRDVSMRGQDVFRLIEECGKPVIACINGAAFGGGLELALACTMRIASDRAKLGLPEVKLGLIPGYGGTQRLPRTIGRGAALKLMLTAETVDASRALQLGLVDEVVAADDLITRARQIAASIVAMAPLAVSGIIAAVQATRDKTFAEGLEIEADIFSKLCATRDKHEGLTAFLEKRQPIWQGK